MLVLSNEEIEGLLTMPECLAVLEEAYRDLAAAKAATSPRVDNLAPCGRDDAYYAFKHMGGLWPCASTRTSLLTRRSMGRRGG